MLASSEDSGARAAALRRAALAVTRLMNPLGCRVCVSSPGMQACSTASCVRLSCHGHTTFHGLAEAGLPGDSLDLRGEDLRRADAASLAPNFGAVACTAAVGGRITIVAALSSDVRICCCTGMLQNLQQCTAAHKHPTSMSTARCANGQSPDQWVAEPCAHTAALHAIKSTRNRAPLMAPSPTRPHPRHSPCRAS